MHCNAHRTQVAHAEHTADDIAAKVVEYQDLPDGFTFGCQDRGRGGQGAVRMRFIIVTRVDRLIQVEYLLDRCFREVSTPSYTYQVVLLGWLA